MIRFAGVLAVALLVGCGSGGSAPTGPHHVDADVYLPSGVHRAPVVVLVPGGSWRTADRTGLRPLAETLSHRGMVAVPASYRAADDGVRFPVPVEDVACDVAFAVARTRAAGITPGPVVVLGHSAGGHLAALVALAGAHFRGDCPYPAAHVDALIGLAGVYDVTALPDVAEALFGVSPDAAPSVWRRGNATTWAASRPDLPVLLLHGADDTTVPTSITTSFADRLRAAGHRVRVEIVPGADHGTIYLPQVAADRITAWIDALPGS